MKSFQVFHKIGVCMKQSLMLFALLVLVSGPLAARQDSEKRLIAAAQKVPARELDATLGLLPLVKWLGALAGDPSNLGWELNDCGEQTGGPSDSGRDFPACVEATVPVGPDATAHVSLMVGTFARGVVGRPKLFQLYIERDGKYQVLKSLSELLAFAEDQSN